MYSNAYIYVRQYPIIEASPALSIRQHGLWSKLRALSSSIGKRWRWRRATYGCSCLWRECTGWCRASRRNDVPELLHKSLMCVLCSIGVVLIGVTHLPKGVLLIGKRSRTSFYTTTSQRPLLYERRRMKSGTGTDRVLIALLLFRG